jgi:FkbM family methyltransferase
MKVVIQGIKRWIFVIIRIRVINVLLRGLLKPFSPILPDSIVSRIPVAGKVYLRLPDSEKVLILKSDGDDPTASRLCWCGLRSFEPETIDLYFHLIKHSKIVFDVGAHTGLFALLAAIDSRDREIHAFEPVPKIFDYLVRNIKINGLTNLKPVCGAATDYDGEIPLYIPHSIALPYSSSTLKGFRKASETIVVTALKIDTYVAANNITRVDLLKIDTEGTEYKVLEGAKGVLERDK